MKYNWLTFPILGDGDLGDRVLTRLDELGWDTVRLDNRATSCGYSCPLSDIYGQEDCVCYYGNAGKLQRVVDGEQEDDGNFIGDFDVLFETDAYAYGAVDLTRKVEVGPPKRRVVRSIPLF